MEIACLQGTTAGAATGNMKNMWDASLMLIVIGFDGIDSGPEMISSTLC